MIHKFLFGLKSEEAGSNSINLGSLKFVFLAKWLIDLQNRKKHKAFLLEQETLKNDIDKKLQDFSASSNLTGSRILLPSSPKHYLIFLLSSCYVG